MKNNKYEEIRSNGLYSSYVLHTLVTKLRVKYAIPKKVADYSRWITTSKITKIPEVTILARQLELDPVELQYYVITNNRDPLTTTVLSTIANDDNNAGIFRSDDDYLPPGVYIKVDINTTKEMIQKGLQRAKRRISQIQTTRNKHRVQLSDIDTENIEYHRLIENALTNLMKDPTATRDSYGPFEDQLVKIAVEQVAGEIIKNKYGEDDETDHSKEEVELQSRIRDRYYKFVRRYRLPTVRDLPTLLRLTGL